MKDAGAVRMLVLGMCVAAAAVAAAHAQEANESPAIRDLLWVWGNPEMAEAGPHTLATFAQAAPAERAKLLDVPNIAMGGNGLPRDEVPAMALTAEVAHAPRLVWEIGCDDENGGPPFEYGKTVARVADVGKAYPQVEGVLLDDMSSQQIDRGLKPEHIAALRALLRAQCPQIKLWGVLYTMNYGIANIDDYIRELDVISLWVWHATDLGKVEESVAYLEERFPEKPIVLGLYLYDYGNNKPMSPEQFDQQCGTALKLAHAKRIEGMVFLTITNDAGIVGRAAEWVKRVGGQKVGSPETAAAGAGQGPGPALQLDGQWRFSGEPWTQDEEGVIRPPDKRNLHSRAFWTGQAYADLEVEFEFNGDYRETGTGSAGILLRSQDVNHAYLVYFPWGGQQLRAKHFWAAVATIDGDAYLRHLAAEWVPGVPSETDRWYSVRVAAQGPSIDVWVDGRRAVHVEDDTYSSGLVGLAGYGWYRFRNIRAAGTPVQAQPWNAEAAIPSHAFTIGLSSEEMPSACIAPDGDVLIAAGSRLVRSKDKGRTWQAPETLPESLGKVTDYGNTMFATPDGRLMVMVYHPQAETGNPVPGILMSESPDNGATWTEPVPSTVAPEWPAVPKNLVPYGPVTLNNDGVLMRFLLGGAMDEGATFTDVRSWSATHCKAYVIRSADSGATWSAPIELDRPSWTNAERGTIPGSLDLTEPTAVVMGQTVTALIRPVYSPYMWQCWSYDGGATWDAASRATFPGYAQSMAKTASGALVCAHRYPHYAVNVSRDGGLHWDAGTVIDYAAWAMGTITEVEPNLVLCTYMNAERSMPLLAQLVRVLPDRLEPLARE
ncbi:MAG TPA: exo-alpha-sialidase [Candidatus Hydrogenedentes bacterium]|nr:exo-alpha-sialidase [Candidatus Hydrogenedentota bacterium]